MRKLSVNIRVPQKDYQDIKKIADNLNINIASAFSLWKRKNKIGADLTWREI